MDSAPSHQGRISGQAATGSTIALFIIAILVASFRTFVRWHYHKLSWLDDGFLAFAIVLMTVSMGLWFKMMGNLYITESLIYDPFGSATIYGNIIQIAIDVQTYTTTYIAITVTAIFAVKFSFLFFFRSLISRLHSMVIYWRVVVAYTAVTWAISIGISFLACPYFDSRAVNCAQGNMLQRALNVSIALLVFDVSSDALIISIPALVIRKVKIPVRSKIYLMFSFCLSAVMIVCSILQGATLVTGGVDAIDVVWQIYFQMIELTLAVTVVSLTAFRTFFIQRGSRSNTPRSPANAKWYSYKKWKKSISDRTTSTGVTGMTGFTGFSEDMQLGDAPRRAGESAPDPRELPIDNEPAKDIKSPLSPGDAEKGPISPDATTSTTITARSPTKGETYIPISPQTPFTPGKEPPHSPSPQQPVSNDSSASSPNDIAMPIQGSESPSSITPIHTPLPTPWQPPPPPEPPRLGSLTSYSTAAGLPPRTPPYPKPMSSLSSSQRPALQGPNNSAHTSRTDSLSRSLSGRIPSNPLETIPQIPPLPQPAVQPPASQLQIPPQAALTGHEAQQYNPLSSNPPHLPPSITGASPSRTSTISSFRSGVPNRKPLPSQTRSSVASSNLAPTPVPAPRPSPSPSKASSIAAAAASLGMDDCFPLSSSSISQRAGTAAQQQRARQVSTSSFQGQTPHIQSQLSPRSHWQSQRSQAQGYQHNNVMSPSPEPPNPPPSASTSGGPRTPRSNLVPELRISGVQRAIWNGIEKAMSFEPATGEGDRW